MIVGPGLTIQGSRSKCQRKAVHRKSRDHREEYGHAGARRDDRAVITVGSGHSLQQASLSCPIAISLVVIVDPRRTVQGS